MLGKGEGPQEMLGALWPLNLASQRFPGSVKDPILIYKVEGGAEEGPFYLHILMHTET